MLRDGLKRSTGSSELTIIEILHNLKRVNHVRRGLQVYLSISKDTNKSEKCCSNKLLTNVAPARDRVGALVFSQPTMCQAMQRFFG
jgi:hypothetical protein